MEILLATHNTHKAEEIQAIIPAQFQLKTLTDIGFHEAIEETGTTFPENAEIKAKAAFKFAQIPCFADDSGLCIEALNGNPGLYSARYAGTGKSEDNIAKVLEELKGKTNRNAYFIAVFCYFDGKTSTFFEGKIEGTIIEELKGTQGFGYDPIFIPKGYSQTFAELSAEEKNKISHRALALQQLTKFLETP